MNPKAYSFLATVVSTDTFKDWRGHPKLVSIEQVGDDCFDLHLKTIPGKKIMLTPLRLSTDFVQEMKKVKVQVRSCWISSGGPEGGTIRIALEPRSAV